MTRREKKTSSSPIVTPLSLADDSALTDRQREILRLVIQQYVLTANPVGSRLITRISPLGLSDASTRNIMADLEYLGLIDHPHTSAGRTPTDKGYRVYVNDLMAREKVTEAERKAVARSFVDAVTDEDVLSEATGLLAKLSKQLSLVLLPALDEGKLERVEIVQLSSNRILIVLAASSGRVRSVTLETDSEIASPKLEQLRMQLNERLAGLSFREIKQTFSQRIADLAEDEKSILRVFLDSPDKLFDEPGVNRVKLTGAKNILTQPEFQKISTNDEEFETVIELIENEEVLIHILERSAQALNDGRSGSDNVAIRIGRELQDERMLSYSIICTRFKLGDQTGTIGVIGPKRMNYDRITPLVEYIARSVSNALAAG